MREKNFFKAIFFKLKSFLFLIKFFCINFFKLFLGFSVFFQQIGLVVFFELVLLVNINLYVWGREDSISKSGIRFF